jgi:hypothetical protein
MERNQNFLREVLGNYVGDGGAGMQGAVQMGAAQSGADNAGNAVSIGLAGRASEGQLSSMRGAENMAHGERAMALLSKRQEDQRAIENEIARIRAQAPMLRRQFGREDEELRIAKQDLALRRQQVADARAANAAQIDLGYYQTNAGAAADAAGNAADAAKEAAANRGKYGYNIDKKYDTMLDELFKSVASPTVPDPADPTKTVPNAARRWRALITAMQGFGLTGGQAVLLASKWVPERLKIHGARSPQVIYKILKSGELGFKLSDAVAKQVFQLAGLNWAHRNKKPSSGGANRPVSGILGPNPGGTVGAGTIHNGGISVQPSPSQPILGPNPSGTIGLFN